MSSNHAHGVSVSYSYDDLNRLSTVVDANLTGSGTTSYTYDNANNVGSVAYPNGVTSQFSYDTLNRVTGLSSQPASYTYQRGPTGNITNATESTGRTEQWNYDGIYRLTSETISLAPSGHNGIASYSLDPVGNRLSDSSSLSSISSGSWGYNSDDEVSSESYDPNGNVTSTGGKTFAYDSENHLMSMTASGTSVSIVYDGDGNRVAKSVNGVTTYYLVDDLNPTGYAQVVEELAASGTVERQYTYGLQRISENQLLSNVWTANFYGYDGGGNVRNLTSSAGAVTDTYEYDAFGNALVMTGSTPNEFLYRGEQFDPDLGLYYLRARYYNPNTGRFMSRDPENGQLYDEASFHKYLYAGSNPVNYVDPRGRDLFEYAMQSNAAIPEAKLLSIYGCLGSSILTATSLIIQDNIGGWDLAGLVGTTIGCVTISVPPEAKVVGKVAKLAIRLVHAVNYGACGASIGSVVHDLNELIDNPSNTNVIGTLVDSIGSMFGCVSTKLGYLIEDEE
jgi:RHS repeat-associated protein